MNLPEAAGLTTRGAQRSDIAAIAALVAACETVDDGVAEVHATDIEQSLGLAGPSGVLLVEAPDGLAGWASVTGDHAEADVHPAWRGRGIGSALLAWTETRARASGAARVRQVVTDADRRAQQLFESAGYAIHHTSWILRMTLDEDPPQVAAPPGIAIRPYRDDDAAAAFRVIDDAFNEWPDRTPTDFAAWSAHVLEHPSFAPQLSRLAFDGDELVGVALTDAYEGQEEGWVEQVATRASHRRRGIARGLLQSVFAAHHATGRRAVGLSTGSQTGALAPYERIGMRVRRSYTAWERILGTPTPSAGSGGAR
jgi:predicted N-acetyltransferase YhbS